MNLYSYCVTLNMALPNLITGVSKQALQLISEDSLGAIVSEYARESVPVTREHVLEHEQVVRAVLKESTPLPFRFGTLTSEKRLRSFLTARSDSLATKLREVCGCVEMSVKIIWRPPSDSALHEIVVEPISASGKTGAGARFLLSKQKELEAEALARQHADEIRSWLESLVADCVVAAVYNVQPNEKLVISSAHLVKRAALDQYRMALDVARSTRPELRFLISGPWAPYSFSNIDLEFKT